VFDQVKQQWVSLSDDTPKAPEKIDDSTAADATKRVNATKEYPTVDAMGRTIVRFPAALVRDLFSSNLISLVPMLIHLFR